MGVEQSDNGVENEMTRDDVCELVSFTPAQHGIFENRTEQHRLVFCQIHSISRYDFWRAKENNLDLDLTFVLTHDTDYEGERWILHNGQYYKVERTYVRDDGSIEIHTRKATPDPQAAPTDNG